jgi:3-dehydroquinate synthase
VPTLEVQFPSGPRTRCVIEAGAATRTAELARDAGLTGTGAVLCDARLPALHADVFARLRKDFGDPVARPVQEARKALAEVEALCEALAARGLQRDGFVVAIGGGVLTDLAGFAAAVYLRGVPWVSVPTTLLAQVDAGLGGKTGANLRAGKNLVGAFHQPRLLVCDPSLLSTLPRRELWSGLGEVVKCALLEGGDLLERCERDLERAAQGDAGALAPLIEGSVRLKARIVAEDEKEGGKRAFLNLGHTVGHALEAATQYSHFTHGEAVALGLRGTLALSDGMPDRTRAERLVARLEVVANVALDEEQRNAALAAMTRDKKARAGKVRFVVLERIGAPRMREASPDECQRALAAAVGGAG